jgi:hypothetical protein
LEAAILLPFFIIGIMTLGFTIRMISTAENITFAASDEARLISSTAYNMPVAPFFSGHLEERILRENKFVTSAEISKFLYLYPHYEHDGQITFRVDAWIENGLPLGMTSGSAIEQNFRSRGFIGRTAQTTPLPFEEMEKNEEALIVWLFPEGGERYHRKTCSFVSSYPIQMILNSEIKKRYTSCPKCGSAQRDPGMQVYCFPAYGESYHLRECPLVDKYIISMEKNQAEARGYTPCLKCGGVE